MLCPLRRSDEAYMVRRSKQLCCGSVATGRVSDAGQVEGSDDADETEHPGPPGWGLGERPTTSQDLTET